MLSRSVMSDSLRPPCSIACHATLSIGILQARIVEWVAYPFFRGPSWPGNQSGVSCIAGRLSTSWATRELRGLDCTPLSGRWNSLSLEPGGVFSFGKCSSHVKVTLECELQCTECCSHKKEEFGHKPLGSALPIWGQRQRLEWWIRKTEHCGHLSATGSWERLETGEMPPGASLGRARSCGHHNLRLLDSGTERQ